MPLLETVTLGRSMNARHATLGVASVAPSLLGRKRMPALDVALGATAGLVHASATRSTSRFGAPNRSSTTIGSNHKLRRDAAVWHPYNHAYSGVCAQPATGGNHVDHLYTTLVVARACSLHVHSPAPELRGCPRNDSTSSDAETLEPVHSVA